MIAHAEGWCDLIKTYARIILSVVSFIYAIRATFL